MPKIVKLNVGGKRFETTEITLMRVGDSMLARMIQQPNEMEMINQGQELFIDRDGEYFAYVLNYLRNGNEMIIPQENTVCKRLIDEAQFYQLLELAGLIRDASALKVGDTVQLQDSNGARAYFDSMMTKEIVRDTNKYKCWICFSTFQLLPFSYSYEYDDGFNKSKIPIKHDTLVEKLQLSMVNAPM